MIGAFEEHARTFLLVYVVVTTPILALPLFLTPLRWASSMRFVIPTDTDLAVYFGRCLGALILVLEAVTLRAALTGEGLVLVFEIMLAAFVLMIGVHAYGAVKRIQPITETLEIGVWILLVLLALAFFPGTATA